MYGSGGAQTATKALAKECCARIVHGSRAFGRGDLSGAAPFELSQAFEHAIATHDKSVCARRPSCICVAFPDKNWLWRATSCASAHHAGVSPTGGV